MTKIAGSGSESESISQKHGSAGPDPDPYQNVMDPQHWSAALDAMRYQYLSRKKCVYAIGSDKAGRSKKPCLKVWVKSASVTSIVASSRSTSSASPGSRDIEYNTGDSQGCRPPPPRTLLVVTAGKNHLNEEITPLHLTGIGKRCSQTISNLGNAARLR
jgi:hypothetical protein